MIEVKRVANEKLDLFWDDNPIDISRQANFIYLNHEVA